MSQTAKSTPEETPAPYDVVIVGGGAAGLAAAVALGRSLRSVLVIDGGAQRNLPSDAAHNVLGREGIAPGDLVREGRAEAESYGVEFVDGTVSDARRDASGAGFTVDVHDGSIVAARRVILATGLVDVLPDIEGVRQAWGQGVLHCPYCHGYEVRGRRIGVIATAAPLAVHQALLFARLADRVTVFANGVDFDDEQRADLDVMEIGVVDGAVSRVHVDGREARAIEVGGERHDVDAVVVATRMVARTELYERLGGQSQEHPMGRMIPADENGATQVAGVWTAGNAADLAAMVAVAAGAGVKVGAFVNADLVADDVREARARAREG
ncbi:NAD(P)/FAD-dependent oxidoreductase [Gordonia liuliyuniae]|uniref:NAD(P)/FAD-dependent oxidoreductase n=1 Tax=Gordonia liuliyuniae TaxID=2911517 RepID=A0ABS9IR04_9ACTN|nr:NAD(P)/FAD-dependent oxidoreductase [Gordonia liuliyuniae]MCF8587952.1 NAD(P)/FAD-dependent oxidoreductase [Gordonia liuliyuniae]